MGNIDVKRIGNVCTVFFDQPGGGVTLPITSFDEEPQGYPETMDVNGIFQRFPGATIRWVNPPQAPLPINARDGVDQRVVQAEVLKILGAKEALSTPARCSPASEHPAKMIEQYAFTMKVALATASKKHVNYLTAKLEAAEEILRLVNGQA